MVIEQAVAEGIILGMGNPLLDISATVGDDVLTKYKLESNNAILAGDEHQPLYKELTDSYSPDFIAGGATQNSIRVAQWMLQSEKATSYFGAVGSDDYSEKMTKCSVADGVNVQYFKNADVPTGTCAVLINGKNRSLVANLAAANTYPIAHLKEDAQWNVATKAEIYYISGFFLTVSAESMMTVARHAKEAGKTFCFNLAAPFLIQVPPFFESMKALFPYVDVLFGNEDEAETLAKAMGWGEGLDITAIARKIAELPKEGSKPRTVVITHGSKATAVVIAEGGKVASEDAYPVIPIAASDIIDTNGAGDAFVGGYLAGLAAKDEVKECVNKGHYAANVIIQHSGCAFPAKPTYSK